MGSPSFRYDVALGGGAFGLIALGAISKLINGSVAGWQLMVYFAIGAGIAIASGWLNKHNGHFKRK